MLTLKLNAIQKKTIENRGNVIEAASVGNLINRSTS